VACRVVSTPIPVRLFAYFGGLRAAQQNRVRCNPLPTLPEWARDLPGDAHGDEGETLIMPASTTHLYCMRRIFGEHGEGATARLQALQVGN
jgi:hypothetical protein